ncbi:MAG: molybdopterin molybdotransferase MoeA, partial [Acidobacteriota bacterium]|nr:molybdopterin molybdotransferase MoeA [Acidobacteriota bacterium]
DLRVVGPVLAGHRSDGEVGPGEAMRIMTGAPLPAGADSVRKVEDVTLLDEGRRVRVPGGIRAGDNVRHPGEDVAVGDLIVASGEVLGPARLGVLASQGRSAVVAIARPRVGVLSTGNELSDSPDPLPRGMIRDSNRPTVLAALRQSGFGAVDLGRCGDQEAQIVDRLRDAVRTCDAVISTGGVSVGDVDFVKSALATISGDRARWMQIAVRPGKPFAFATVGERETPIFGLPGNPVSTLVSFELLVRPALRRLAGHPDLERPVVAAVTDTDLARSPDGKLHVVHVTGAFADDGKWHVRRALRQGSHLLSATAAANGLALVPDGHGVGPGGTVSVLLLDDIASSVTTPWGAT